MRTIEEITNISPVAASQSVTVTVPVGRTLERLTFRMGGTFTLAQLANIALRVNGKVIQEYADGTVLDAINKFYGLGDASGEISLWMIRPWLKRRPDDAFVTGLGTSDVQTVQVTADIGAATSPTLTAYGVFSAPQPMGAICKVRRISANAAGTLYQFDSLPRGPRLMAAHVKKTDANDVELLIESRRVIDGSKTDLHNTLTRFGRTPQTGYTHLDFCMADLLDDALVTVVGQGNQARPADMRLQLTLGTSGAFDVYAEMLDSFEGV